MAGDSIANSPAKGPEQIANDVLRNVGAMTEAAREASLPASAMIRPVNNSWNNGAPFEGGVNPPYYQHPSPSSNYFQWPQQIPAPGAVPDAVQRPNENYYQGLSSAGDNFALQTELQTQLDGYHGTSSRHRLAAAEDLADVVSKVNNGGLADGLKLGPIDDAAKLHILNSRDHSNLTIDLGTGKISDQSGNEYVANDQVGRVDFTPKEPVTVKSGDNFSVTYDAKDQLTKIALPDGTILAKTSPQTFSVSDATTKPTGLAENLRYDGRTLSYESSDDNGKTFVVVRGDHHVRENLETGEISAKRTDDAGNLLPVLDPAELIVDQALLSEVASTQGVVLPRPKPLFPERHNPHDDPI